MQKLHIYVYNYLLIDAIFIWILQVLKNGGINRVHLFSILSCITANMVKSSLVPHKKFIEGPRTVSYSICPNFDSLWLG